MKRPFLTLVLIAVPAAAQILVEGEVVNKSTGQPLAGMRVIASCLPDPAMATDSAGRFQLSAVPAGTCVVSAEGPRFLTKSHIVTIAQQDTRIAIRIPLTPASAIAGKVVDENGWPIPGAAVTVGQYQNVLGGLQLRSEIGRASCRERV